MKYDNLVTYKGSIEKDRIIKVYLGKKIVGNIVSTDGDKFQYIPKGKDSSEGGEKFSTLQLCKDSLECE